MRSAEVFSLGGRPDWFGPFSSFISLLSAFENAGAGTAGPRLTHAVSSCLQSPVPELERTKARVFSAAFNYG